MLAASYSKWTNTLAIVSLFCMPGFAVSQSRAAIPKKQPAPPINAKAQAPTAPQAKSATTLKPKSEAEQYVFDQLQLGPTVDLEKRFPAEKRQLRAEFLRALFTSRDPRLPLPRGIDIRNALIVGGVDLRSAEIPHDIEMSDCVFDSVAEFSGSHFAKGLTLTGVTFKSGFYFVDVSVEHVFNAFGSNFQDAQFYRLTVGRSFMLFNCKFNNLLTSFGGTHVKGPFIVASSFTSRAVEFAEMKVEGVLSVSFSDFRARPLAEGESDTNKDNPSISFEGTHAGEFFLDRATFGGIATIDFTRLQVDRFSAEEVIMEPAPKIKHRMMSFKRLNPMDAEKLKWLLTPYDAEFYASVETSFRANGYPGEADEIYIQGKRAERRQKCSSLWSKCESRTGFLWSLFRDGFAGYGKSLQNLLYWGAGFVVIGSLVFRRREGMKLKDENHRGKYHAVWYSLDLFLPFIKLGEADKWTPKEDRRWANLYKKFHIIIGSLFVPIGLAALTGIIR